MGRRRRTLTALSTVPLLLTSACGAAETANSGTGPTTPTTGGPTSTEASRSAAGTTPDAVPDHCLVDTQAEAILGNLWQVPEPALNGETWGYYGHSNYNPCADLSYATVYVTGSDDPLRQNQLLLFHRGGYLGVGALTPQTHEVITADDESVTVHYVDFEAMERDQAPATVAGNYRVEVTFLWNGAQVEPIGRIPNQEAVPQY